MKSRYIRVFFLTLALLLLAGCRAVPGQSRLKVFIAGSLMVPFDDLEQTYEAAHPGVDVQVEAHGSIQVIRHVTEIHDEIDVVVPADHFLIPLLMYDNPAPESGEDYADWYVEFASNQLALAFTDESAYADEITAEKWYEVIAREDVELGLSDPRFDASGYRTLMIAQLAETYYQDPTIFERIFLGQFTQPITSQKSGQEITIHVPEVLDPSENASVVMRGSSIALIALLESGDIDYAFEYLSVIEQHGLRYVPLPGMLNLGDPEFVEEYQNIQVQLDFKRFSTVTPLFPGSLIGYGVAIPSNAPNKELAEDFVAFLIGEEGREIMARNFHPPLAVPLADGRENLPGTLVPLTQPRP